MQRSPSPRRAVAPDKGYYIGALTHSLERLPQWYQILALGGVAIALYLRNTAVVQWLVVYLHSSLGTSALWPPDYRAVLDAMTFDERIAFTLYGAALAAAVALLYRAFCRGTVNVGWSAGELFAGRATATALVYALLCAVEVARLRGSIAATLADRASLAHAALHRLAQQQQQTTTTTTGATHSVAEDVANLAALPRSIAAAGLNLHACIQLAILQTVLTRLAREQLPVFAVACAWRLLRDVPRRVHASLRWHMATVACVTLARALATAPRWGDADALALAADVAWAALYLGVVNFLYGPSKRAGLVATVQARAAARQTLRCAAVCAAMWVAARLLVLTLAVGVHVVELVCVWLALALLLVWAPAIVDAVALDYLAVLTTVACGVARAMGCVDDAAAAARLGALAALWLLNICLLYNVVVNACRSRYAGIAVLACLALAAVAPPPPPPSSSSPAAGAAGVAAVAARRLAALRDIAAHAPSSSWRRWGGDADDSDAAAPFRVLMCGGVAVCAALVAAATAIARAQGADTRARLRRRSIVCVTAAVFARKLVRAAVHAVCVASFVLSWWVCARVVLPAVAARLPVAVGNVAAVLVACAVLGGVVDAREAIYDAAARVLGFADPPPTRDDGGEADDNDDDDGGRARDNGGDDDDADGAPLR